MLKYNQPYYSHPLYTHIMIHEDSQIPSDIKKNIYFNIYSKF